MQAPRSSPALRMPPTWRRWPSTTSAATPCRRAWLLPRPRARHCSCRRRPLPPTLHRPPSAPQPSAFDTRLMKASSVGFRHCRMYRPAKRSDPLAARARLVGTRAKLAATGRAARAIIWAAAAPRVSPGIRPVPAEAARAIRRGDSASRTTPDRRLLEAAGDFVRRDLFESWPAGCATQACGVGWQPKSWTPRR